MRSENSNVNELITMARCVAERKRAEAGMKALTLEPGNLPSTVRPLLQHAEILGTGDDVVRNEIFAAVPSKYLDIVRDAIAESSGLFEWYRRAESTEAKHLPEVAAIGWMLFGLNLG